MRRIATWLIVLSSFTAAHTAHAIKLRVRGTARIEAHAVPLADSLELRGQVRDDSGAPIPEANLQVKLKVGGAATQPGLLRCTRKSPAARIDHASGSYVVATGEDGAFCLRFAERSVTGVAVLEYPGSDYYEPTAQQLTLDSTRRSLAMRLLPEPRALAIERQSYPVWLETELTPPIDPEESSELIELGVAFQGRSQKKPKSLPAVHITAGDRTLLELQPATLGPPGPGTLSITYAGSAGIQQARLSVPIIRSARVQLALAAGPPSGDPTQGVTIPVRVTSSAGPVPSGGVEALVGGASVGFAAVNQGAAELHVAFDPPSAQDVPVTLRYVPNAEWWVADTPLLLSLPIPPPSPWRRVPWVVGALGVVFWVVRGWLRPGRSAKPRTEETSPSGRPSLEVLPGNAGGSEWSGKVLDAHDGTPLANVLISIRLPSFGERETVSTRSDEAGAFELSAPEARGVEGARIVFTSPWHATLDRPLPPPSRVTAQLLARRRALLVALVDWAQRRGPPWSTTGEPTPAQVSRLGRKQRDPAVADWADAVEQAAYGPDPVDESREAGIREREPR